MWGKPSAVDRTRLTLSLAFTVIVGPGFVTVVWVKPHPMGPAMPPHRFCGPYAGFGGLAGPATEDIAGAIARPRNTTTRPSARAYINGSLAYPVHGPPGPISLFPNQAQRILRFP